MSDEQFHRNQMEAHGRELQGIDHYLNNPEDNPAAAGDGPGASSGSLVAELQEYAKDKQVTWLENGPVMSIARRYDAEIARLRARVAELEDKIERWTSEAEDRDLDTDN